MTERGLDVHPQSRHTPPHGCPSSFVISAIPFISCHLWKNKAHSFVPKTFGYSRRARGSDFYENQSGWPTTSSEGRHFFSALEPVSNLAVAIGQKCWTLDQKALHQSATRSADSLAPLRPLFLLITDCCNERTEIRIVATSVPESGYRHGDLRGFRCLEDSRRKM